MLKEIRARITMAMREQDSVTRDVLRLCISEASKVGEPTDELVAKACKKIIEANEETLRLGGANDKLSKEIEVIKSFLPKEVVASREDIDKCVESFREMVIAAKNAGQAIGLIMKDLKSRGFTQIDNAQVRSSLDAIRSNNL